MNDLYLIGGGGHCRSCIDVIEKEGKFKIKGIFDLKENLNKEILGYKIIGTDQEIEKYISNSTYFLITLGQIKNYQTRENLFKKLSELKAQIPNVVSPRAYISKHAVIGVGNIFMHDTVVNSNAKIGNNNIFNTKSLIEHDVIIGSHCHVSTGAVVNGDCVLGDGVFIGSNSVLEQGKSIKVGAVICAGSFYRG